MVDTVIIKLHDLNKFPHLLLNLNRKKSYGISGQTQYTPNPSMTPIEVIMTSKADGSLMQVQKYDYVTYLPSHSSKIVVYLNHTDNYARINVSLPKLVYGHNVRHLYNDIPLPNPSDAYQSGWNGFIYGIEVLFSQLLESAPPWSQIEIERIDLCMNWLALDMQHSKHVLQSFMMNRRAYQRVNAPVYAQYQTTVFHKTDRYSFKVYHKGSEFLKHDFNKMYKQNKDVANKVLDIAQKTLRFEVSFRKPFISYIFHRNTIPLPLKAVIDSEDLNQAAQNLADEIFSILPNGMSIYQVIETAGLTSSWQDIKRTAKGVRKLVNRSPNFIIGCNTIFNLFGIAETQARFDLFVFKLLAERFQIFINDMGVNHEMLPKNTPDKIKKYAAMTSRFQDFELIQLGMYTPQVIKNYRSLHKKYLKQGTKFNSFNMEQFNEQWLF